MTSYIDDPFHQTVLNRIIMQLFALRILKVQEKESISVFKSKVKTIWKNASQFFVCLFGTVRIRNGVSGLESFCFRAHSNNT